MLLRREAAFPRSRTRLWGLALAGLSLLLLASAADALLWRYSAEREQLRTQAVDARGGLAEVEGQLHAIAGDVSAVERGYVWGRRVERSDATAANTCTLRSADVQRFADLSARVHRALAEVRALRREAAAGPAEAPASAQSSSPADSPSASDSPRVDRPSAAPGPEPM